MKTVLDRMLYVCLTTSIFVLLESNCPVKGCLWEENIMPDNRGNISSVSNITQIECCQLCLDSFNDTLAAYYIDSYCTCVNISHNRVPYNGSYYTYITRDPVTLNQSYYECGSFGSFHFLTFYYVADNDRYDIKVINMDLNLNLSTSILMMYNQGYWVYFDGAYVGLGDHVYGSSYASVNRFQNITGSFKTGYINVTTHFALSYARGTFNSKVIVYIKPFYVVTNVKFSTAELSSAFSTDISTNSLWSVINVKNDYFDMTADAVNLVLMVFYNPKLLRYEEYQYRVGGPVRDVAREVFFPTPNTIKMIIPRLRCGANIQLRVGFFSLVKNQQQVESAFIELSATVYLNGSSLKQVKNNNIHFSNIKNQVRNRRFIGDIISILQLEDVVLLCEWAIDRTRNYCGFYSLDDVPTITRLSAVFIEPICFDNMTKNIYFQDKFGNVLCYNYLNKGSVRLPDKKEKFLKLPSLILPLTKVRNQYDYFCCDTQVGSLYRGTPLLTNRYKFFITARKVNYVWTEPALYLPGY